MASPTRVAFGLTLDRVKAPAQLFALTLDRVKAPAQLFGLTLDRVKAHSHWPWPS